MNFNATFFGQLIAFAVFVWFCMKYVWPPLLRMIEMREQRIADGLAAGEEGQLKLKQADERLRESIEEGKQRAAGIISQAQRRSDEIVEEAKQAALVEGGRQMELAHAEIERERERARQELREKLADLAVAGARQILRREIRIEDHSKILSELGERL
ncbi:MAG: F0F1 ATP synthase subunit B [Candidatus Eutrophobiaceae bacterium]